MVDISQDFLDTHGRRKLRASGEINQRFGGNYIAWFNTNLAGRGAWAGKSIPDSPAAQARFAVFWDDTSGLFPEQPSLMQFVCLMSIFTNEVGGDLIPIREKVGRPPLHPGIAYAFNRIEGLKRSYNTLAGNRTAFALFRDPAYREAHKMRGGFAAFADPAAISAAWDGETYTAGFPTSTDEPGNGFILQADFFKFRGRGLIQTTGRANYLKLIDFVKTYAGPQALVRDFAARWAGQDNQRIATISSNEDWDRLFLKSDLVIARAAIAFHNQGGGNYLALADRAATLNGNGAGSIRRMGLRISGGADYAECFHQRVAVLCAAAQSLP
jgi:hypothetical protein